MIERRETDRDNERKKERVRERMREEKETETDRKRISGKTENERGERPTEINNERKGQIE